MLPRAFFSFVDLTDDTRHAEYNAWHLYDHRPENLALPGVAWGDRWARLTGDADHAGTAVEEFASVDYVANYWFREPLEQTIADFLKLGADSVQWGRGPGLPGVVRRLTAFFTPVKGYAHPRVLVSPDVLPFRPHTGVHVTLSRFAEPVGPDAHLQYRWYDRVRIPDLLEIPGVTGAWTFASSETQSRPGTVALTAPEDAPGSLRVRLLYLDGDPAEVTREIRLREKVWADAGRGSEHAAAEEVLFSAPTRTIVPYQDW